MKLCSFITGKVLIIVAATGFLFASCDLLTSLLEPSSTTISTTSTTATTATTVATSTQTSYKPALSLSTAIEGKNAKIITSDILSSSEYNFALGCPALAGFTDSGTSLGEGSTFQISYLATTVTFTVHYFEDGAADRIVRGVRYTGLSADNSIDLLIDYDPVSKAFYYEQKLFIDDPTGKIFNQANTKSLVYYKMQGAVASDNSIIAYPQGIAFNVIPNQYTFLFSYKKMEYYSGTWDFSTGKKGVGIVLRDASGKTYTEMPATAGGYTKPSESFTVADLPGAIGYMKAALAAISPDYGARYHLMYKIDGETAFTSMISGIWYDNLAAPTTNTAAKSRLPSATWKAKSVSSKY